MGSGQADLMNITDQDRWWSVILSAAKNLACHTEILSAAKNDTVPILVVNVH
jgi:hypothetical protein